MLKLSVIGGGKVGSSLGRLWSRNAIFAIGDVLTRAPESARSAVGLIGAGRPVVSWDELEPADVYMLSVPDDAIAFCAARLAESRLAGPGSIAFHCSGSKSSSVLSTVKDAGAQVASLHPVKSFADPRLAAETFAGTYCALEGEEQARAVLTDAVERAGGRCFDVDPEQKLVYHAATVFASNYLVALSEVALRCFEGAGLSRSQALAIAVSLSRGTLDNLERLGTDIALTGPIARGDSALVAEQLRALLDREPDIGRLYARLGCYAVELAERRQSVEASALSRIKEHFRQAV